MGKKARINSDRSEMPEAPNEDFWIFFPIIRIWSPKRGADSVQYKTQPKLGD
jgi:hypothetical protein